jgi:hypothetical protein
MIRRIALLTAVLTFTLSPAAFSQSRAASPKAALNIRLPEVNLQSVPLGDVIDFLRDASGANLHVNWRAIEEVGVGKDTPVSIRLRGATLRKVLTLALTDAAGGADVLAFYPSDGVIEVTTREISDSEMVTRVYPVEDLLVDVPDFDNAPDFNLQQQASAGGGGGGGQLFNGGGGGEDDNEGPTRTERADQLIDLIVNTIQPDIWAANGGAATIRFYNGSLIVRAPRSVHEALGGRVD